ncbi:hypothetical protein BY996DRAFT_6452572 [Phakopsora pachyrhizi]|nr:hypothetical protein BY996DRAFT_6452572 [Phakopsora pachyrhizi]
MDKQTVNQRGYNYLAEMMKGQERWESAFEEGLSSESPEPFRSSATDLDRSRQAFMNPTDIKADRERKWKAEMARSRNQFFEDDSPPWASSKKKRMTMTMAGVKNLVWWIKMILMRFQAKLQTWLDSINNDKRILWTLTSEVVKYHVKKDKVTIPKASQELQQDYQGNRQDSYLVLLTELVKFRSTHKDISMEKDELCAVKDLEQGLRLNISHFEDWELTENVPRRQISFGAYGGVARTSLEDEGDGGAAEDRASLCDLFDGL